MDNHPIPQDVTGFQFRLIGDMTIKQFAYLAGGVILAWIMLSLPIFLLIKLPIALFLGTTGFTLAFIPIGGRPADTMIFYFFKAVFSPTQYVYISSSQQQPMTNTGSQTTSKPVGKARNKQETIHLETPLPTTPFAQQAPPQSPVISPVVQPEPQQPPQQAIEEPMNTNSELSQQALSVANALVEAKNEEDETQKGSQEAVAAHQKAEDLEQQLFSVQEQKKQLEEQLLQLQHQLQQKTQPSYTPSIATPQPTQNVRKIPPSLGKTVGTPFVTDAPNLISGIVKDSRGNVLPNILIEVKDKDGNPVRAFKTNPLGQFASATPVINGTYTISFEDPNGKQRFDSIEISATGDVLAPFEVISIDAREDLRKELFGG